MRSEIAIMGGGPAGSVLAAQLAGLGYTVCLISRTRRVHAVEGLSQRALKGFEFAGFEHTLAAVGPKVRRAAVWNGERHEANHEWIVERSMLDAGLVVDAGHRDVRVLNGTVRHFERTVDGWRVAWTTADRAERHVNAAYLVDARGRGSPRAAEGWVTGPPTFALSRRCRPSADLPSRTLVLTVPDGWIWLAHDSGSGAAVVQLFISTAACPLPPRPDIDAYFERQLAAVAGNAAGWLDLQREDRVEVRDASTAMQPSAIGDGFARAGDAALAIDPLAGHGMYEAISGALALAPVINTVLQRPQHADLAGRFYREKLDTDFWRLARTGRDFYRTETRWPSSDFWRERRAWPDEEPAHRPPLAGEAVVERRPVSENGFIRDRPVVVTPDHPRGVWQVAGVPLAQLRTMAEDHARRPESLVQHAAERLNARPADVDTALAWLRYRGLLPDP